MFFSSCWVFFLSPGQCSNLKRQQHHLYHQPLPTSNSISAWYVMILCGEVVSNCCFLSNVDLCFFKWSDNYTLNLMSLYIILIYQLSVHHLPWTNHQSYYPWCSSSTVSIYPPFQMLKQNSFLCSLLPLTQHSSMSSFPTCMLLWTPPCFRRLHLHPTQLLFLLVSLQMDLMQCSHWPRVLRKSRSMVIFL
jgi:hypothetical protein